MQYLEIKVGKQSYAIPVKDVVSIEEMKEISNVPMPSKYITGMVVIRDEVIQVYDIANRLGVTDLDKYADKKYGNMILVIESFKKRYAMEINLAKDIIELDGELNKVPDSVAHSDNVIMGIIKKDNDIVPVIDVHKLMPVRQEVA